jgi:heat shock protein HslJ
MRWPSTLAAVLAASAVVALAGCGSDGEDRAVSTPGDEATTSVAAGDRDDGAPAPEGTAPLVEDLEGRAFTSTSVTGRELVADTEVRLTFFDGRLGVTAGCNSASSSVEVVEGVLRWSGEPMSTLIGCPEELAAQDRWLTELLTAGATATIAGPELRLEADDVVLVLAEVQAAAVEGTTWTLDALVDGDSASSLPTGVEAPTIEIADGQITVFTGCNRGGGSFEIAEDGASATVGPLATTRMACPGEAAALEAQVLAVLDGEVAIEVDGGQLTIRKGELALGFRST